MKANWATETRGQIFSKGERDSNLLRGNVEGERPHVDLLVGVDAGDDEEDPGAPGPAAEQSTESEDDDTFVFLNHLLETEKGQCSYSTRRTFQSQPIGTKQNKNLKTLIELFCCFWQVP